jgi:hypothetical protein
MLQAPPPARAEVVGALSIEPMPIERIRRLRRATRRARSFHIISPRLVIAGLARLDRLTRVQNQGSLQLGLAHVPRMVKGLTTAGMARIPRVIAIVRRRRSDQGRMGGSFRLYRQHPRNRGPQTSPA